MWIDRLLEKTGIPAAGEEIGRGVGELVGAPEYGAQLGKGALRGLVNVAPMFIPGVGPIARAAGIAGQAAMSGLDVYEKTGSPAAGVIAAGTAGLMPGAAGLAEQTALKYFGAPLVKGQVLRGTAVEQAEQLARGVVPEAVKKYVPVTLGQGLGSMAAGQAAAAGLGVGADIAQQVAAGEDISISPTEQLLNLTLGQAPFAATYLTKGGRIPFGGEAARRHVQEMETSMGLTREVLETKRLGDEAAAKTGVENIPDVVQPSVGELADNNFRINELRAKQRAAQQDGTTFSEEDRQRFVEEEDPIVRKQGAQPGNIIGANIDERTLRRAVVGTEVAFDPETGFRRVQLSDDPRNGELAGKQVGYDTRHESASTEPGVYNLPEGYHSEFLPVDTEGRFDPVAKLRTAEQKLAAAKTNGDLQTAVVELNGVRQSYGMGALDDVQIAGRQREFGLGSARDTVQSEIERTRGLTKAKDEGRELGALEQERVARQAEVDAATVGGDVVAGDAARARLAEIDRRHGELMQKGPRAVPYAQSEQSRGRGDVPVTVDIGKLGVEDVPSQKEKGYPKFAEWFARGKPLITPEGAIDPSSGRPQFGDARHRFAIAALRHLGQKTIEIAVPPDQVARFQAEGQKRESVGRKSGILRMPR